MEGSQMRVRKAVAEWPGEDGEDGGRGEAGKGREIHTHPDAQVKSSCRRGGQGCARTGKRPGRGLFFRGPAQRTETWVDPLRRTPPTSVHPKALLAVHCHHQGVILFSVRGRMHGRRQQAACTQHWHRPGGTREDEAKAERECRASCSRDDAAWNVTQRPTPKLGAQSARARATAGAVQCCASGPLPSQPPGVFFGGCRTSPSPGPGFHGPKVDGVSTRGTTGNIGCARGQGWSRGRGGWPRLALKIGLLELPTACSAGLCQSRRRSTTGRPKFPCCCRRPALHSR